MRVALSDSINFWWILFSVMIWKLLSSTTNKWAVLKLLAEEWFAAAVNFSVYWFHALWSTSIERGSAAVIWLFWLAILSLILLKEPRVTFGFVASFSIGATFNTEGFVSGSFSIINCAVLGGLFLGGIDGFSEKTKDGMDLKDIALTDSVIFFFEGCFPLPLVERFD